MTEPNSPCWDAPLGQSPGATLPAPDFTITRSTRASRGGKAALLLLLLAGAYIISVGSAWGGLLSIAIHPA